MKTDVPGPPSAASIASYLTRLLTFASVVEWEAGRRGLPPEPWTS